MKNNTSQKKKIKNIPISFFIADGKMFEQVIINGICQFAVWDFQTKSVSYVNSYPKSNNEAYIPCYGEEIEKNYIFLPSGIEEYNSDDKLDEDIDKFIIKWLDIEEEHRKYCIWNIRKSWVYDKFQTLNYLRAIGDLGQGKTRYLRTIGYLHYKPIITSGATTSAPLFRIIDKWRGTMLIDECDLRYSDESVEMIKIINLGFEKGNSIMRCDPNNPKVINFFDPYCPKVIVSRKPFEDKATESRCFTNLMDGTNRNDIPFELNKEFFKEAQSLRNKLLLWRFRNYNSIDISLVHKIDLGDIEPRLKQISQGFTPLFSSDESKIAFFKSYIQKKQLELIDERRNSMSGSIVQAICNLICLRNRKYIIPSDIIEEAKLTDNFGNSLKGQSIARYLKEIGLGKRKIMTIDGKSKNCILWTEEKIRRLAKRYGAEYIDDKINTSNECLSW